MTQEELAGHAARRLEHREARAMERSIFGTQSTPKGEVASFERGPAISTPVDLSIVDAYFGTGDTPGCPSDVAAATSSALVDEDAPSFDTPEADRLFARPTHKEAAHALRDLTWGEHIVVTQMAAARGNSATYLYSLQEAAIFFLGNTSGGVSLRSSGSFVWVDLDHFVAWIHDVVGDELFADVLKEKLATQEAYNDKIETMRQLLDLRMTQYIPYLPSDEDEAGGETDGEADGEADDETADKTVDETDGETVDKAVKETNEGSAAMAGDGPGAGVDADTGESARE